MGLVGTLRAGRLWKEPTDEHIFYLPKKPHFGVNKLQNAADTNETNYPERVALLPSAARHGREEDEDCEERPGACFIPPQLRPENMRIS